MDLLVIGDLHGDRIELDEDPSAFDAVLATGDFCGDGLRDAMFTAMEEETTFPELLGDEEAQKRVEDSIEQGREVLEWLDGFGVPVYTVPGNWDWVDRYEEPAFLARDIYREELLPGLDNVVDVDRERIEVDGFPLIGYGPCSGPEKPMYPDDHPDDPEQLHRMEREYMEAKQRLVSLFEAADGPTIFLSHNVPHNTALDEITDPSSPKQGRHYGSVVVREIIERFGPVVSVAGHMHEGYGQTTVSETSCINAGLRSSVTLELDEDGVKSVTFDPEPE